MRASVTIKPSHIQQSLVTTSTTLRSTSQGVTTVGIVLDPKKPKRSQLTLMHAIGNTTLGTALVPFQKNQKPNIHFSRAIPRFGNVGGVIDFRKPLNSTLSAQIPVMILGAPFSVGFDISLRKFKDCRIRLLLPLQPLDFLLRPLGIKLPALQIASISIRKVVKVAGKVFKGIGRLLGIRGFGKMSPEEHAALMRGWEAYYKSIREHHAKQQLVLHFPKDVEELGRLVNELQPTINALLTAQKTNDQLFASLQADNIEIDFPFPIPGEDVREFGHAVKGLQQAAQERQAILKARHAIPESDQQLKAAADKLAVEVSALKVANIPAPSKESVDHLRKLQSELSAAITGQPSVPTNTAIVAIAFPFFLSGLQRAPWKSKCRDNSLLNLPCESFAKPVPA